ncbi:MAG: hypothetical protein K0R18_1531 [Bacillales bacterium]|nr:hypothetical protein [Bacillales bacterium]
MFKIRGLYKVWLESEQWAKGEFDLNNDNTDVFVEFDDNTKWVATFFTYSNISKLVEKNKQTGECLNGKYFWGSDMLLIDVISKERIEEVVRHLIVKGEFENIFSKFLN